MFEMAVVTTGLSTRTATDPPRLILTHADLGITLLYNVK